MPEIVKIIAPTAFDYSHDNGVTLLRYEPGQIYEVPDVSIEGLRRRKAIEILDRKAIDSQLSQASQTGTETPVTGEGPEAGSEGGDEDEDAKAAEVEKAAAKEKVAEVEKAAAAEAAAKEKDAPKATASAKPSRPAK